MLPPRSLKMYLYSNRSSFPFSSHQDNTAAQFLDKKLEPLLCESRFLSDHISLKRYFLNNFSGNNYYEIYLLNRWISVIVDTPWMWICNFSLSQQNFCDACEIIICILLVSDSWLGKLGVRNRGNFRLLSKCSFELWSNEYGWKLHVVMRKSQNRYHNNSSVSDTKQSRCEINVYSQSDV